MTEILNGTYPPQSIRRQLLSWQDQSRQLAYFSNDFPVAITSVVDNEDCEGSDVNPEVMCATIASTVCAVLEDGDDPAEVRATMVAGLQYAVESGDFPEQEELPPTQAPTPVPLPTMCVDFQCKSYPQFKNCYLEFWTRAIPDFIFVFFYIRQTSSEIKWVWMPILFGTQKGITSCRASRCQQEIS